MPRNQKVLLEGSVIGSLLRLAVPLVISNILQTGYQIADAFWVGRLGATAVAAVSICFPVMFLTTAMGAGLSMAGSTLVAQYSGARNATMVNLVAGQTVLMVTLVSLVLACLGFIFSPQIVTLFGVSTDVYAGALGFLRVAFCSVTFQFGFYVFQSIMRGVGEAFVPLYIVFGTVVLNFIINPLLIFGFGPIPPLGVMGAALTTLLTQSIACVVGIVILVRGRHSVILTWESIKPNAAYIKRAFLLGFPASVELSARGLGLMVLSFLVASFGTLTIAAYGVGTTFLQIVTVLAMGLSMATSTLVGQNIGANNTARASEVAVLGGVIGFLTLAVVGVFAFIFAHDLVAFFVPADPRVIAEGAVFIRTSSLAWGFIGFQLCMVSTFRASGNMLAAMMLALVSQWVLQFPLAYVLSKHTGLGPRGLWWSFPVTNVVIAGIALAWFAKGDWKKTRLTLEDQEIAEVTQKTLTEDPMF